ncbi:MAG: PilZ domain-containing protein [Anaerolineae bacterium]|jgi:c-di-GMP-binding flagellar brake protein YcgR|nr:PilZ domain-containing protein [Anaerolineae bacterium]MBT7072826.1 PilZ domain-containing protein [Anaerolineae bacterium]MBT7325820.1 PilZ domain-containing protein [Anaerolineae bacterium]MBT7600606.1 PilZ domain-containing protein [Anaerolineae bacterium]
MEERRTIPRKYLMAYSSVYIQSTGRMLGYLSDLTLGGLMVIGKESIKIGREIDLHIDLPEMPSIDEKFLRIKARVVRCQPDLDPRLFNIGFEFLDLSDHEKPIIAQMIESYEFRREDNN